MRNAKLSVDIYRFLQQQKRKKSENIYIYIYIYIYILVFVAALQLFDENRIKLNTQND